MAAIVVLTSCDSDHTANTVIATQAEDSPLIKSKSIHLQPKDLEGWTVSNICILSYDFYFNDTRSQPVKHFIEDNMLINCASLKQWLADGPQVSVEHRAIYMSSTATEDSIDPLVLKEMYRQRNEVFTNLQRQGMHPCCNPTMYRYLPDLGVIDPATIPPQGSCATLGSCIFD